MENFCTPRVNSLNGEIRSLVVVDTKIVTSIEVYLGKFDIY